MKNLWKKIVGGFVAALILYFMARSLSRSFAEIGTYRLDVSYSRVVLSFCILAVLFLIYGLVWRYILSMFGFKLSFARSMRVWFLSQAGRYIPGKVWFALGRIYLCERSGIPRSVATIAMAYEMSLVLASALVVFGIASICVPVVGFMSYALGMVLVGAILLVSHPSVLRVVLRKFSKISTQLDLKYVDTLKILTIYICCWIIYGIGFYLVATSVAIPSELVQFKVASSFKAMIAMIGINSVAWAGGLLSIITPAGLGVREGISGMLLLNLVQKPYPVLIPLVARLWVTLGEMATIGAVLMRRGEK